MSFMYANLIPYVAALLVYLAGLAVAVILLIRAKGKAAILAVVGFALLVLISIGQIVLAVLPVAVNLYRFTWLVWILNCCCSIFIMAAIVCLIIAIWQAVSGPSAKDVAQEAEYATDPLEGEMGLDAFEESPKVASATVKLEDAAEDMIEGEILEDIQVESPNVTKVLQETQEEAAEDSE